MHNSFLNFSIYSSIQSISLYLFICSSHVGKRENTCQALQCSEDRDLTTLVPAANYRYYSMYSVSSLPGNIAIKIVGTYIQKQIYIFVHK